MFGPQAHEKLDAFMTVTRRMLHRQKNTCSTASREVVARCSAMALSGDDAVYFSHPRASVPEPMSADGLPLLWTGDIDDMLLLNARQHAFDFGAQHSPPVRRVLP